MRYGLLCLLLPWLVVASTLTEFIQAREEDRRNTLDATENNLLVDVINLHRKEVQTDSVTYRKICHQQGLLNTYADGVAITLGLLGNGVRHPPIQQTLINLLGFKLTPQWQQVHYCQLLSGGWRMLQRLQGANSQQIHQHCVAMFNKVIDRTHYAVLVKDVCHTAQQITGKRAVLATALQQHQRCE